jgi:hypothetical protein
MGFHRRLHGDIDALQYLFGPDEPSRSAATQPCRPTRGNQSSSADHHHRRASGNVRDDGLQRIRPSDGLVARAGLGVRDRRCRVAAGLGIAVLVVVQNGYAGAAVTVEADQALVSGGVYKFVRHPMYVGNVIMTAGIPLALGSYWGLLFILSGVLVLVLRILDEEKMLTQELGGYREYAQRVRYRLMPYVW